MVRQVVRKTVQIFCFFSVCLILAGCSGNMLRGLTGQATPAPAADQQPDAAPVPRMPQGPVTIALLIPLSGSEAELGQSMLDAAQLALFDVADDQFQLLPFDTKGTAIGAQDAMNKALMNNPQMVLGPLFSDSVAAVRPMAERARIPVVSFSNNQQQAGGLVYTMGFVPDDQVERVISFTRRQGFSQYAAMIPQNRYGQQVAGAMRSAMGVHGGHLANIISYQGGEDIARALNDLVDFDLRRDALAQRRAQLERQNDDFSRQALQNLMGRQTLGEVPFETVLFPAGGDDLRNIAKLLPAYEINPGRVKILGTGLWDDPMIMELPNLFGSWFAAPDPGPRSTFERRFADTYGKPPLRLASLAYDATALAGVLAKSGLGFDRTSLANPNGFIGIDGIFRFRPDGVAERGLAILEVTPQGVRVIDPAPRSFMQQGG